MQNPHEGLVELALDELDVVSGGNRHTEVFAMASKQADGNRQAQSDRANRRVQIWAKQVDASLQQQKMAQDGFFQMANLMKGSMGGSQMGGSQMGGGDMGGDMMGA